jgi:hypothetical protein
MYCDLCMYFNIPNECSLRGELTPERKVEGCESFIEQPLRICGSPGCCGLSGLPVADLPDESEADKKL